MKFSYRTKSLDGKSKAGEMEAKDKHELAKILRSQGYILVSSETLSAKEKGGGIGQFNISAITGRFFGVPLVEKMMFARHLAVMIDAGLSLNRGLTVLAEQASNASFKKIISKIEEDLRKGNSFADALSRHPAAFNDLFISMVRVGEESGNLEKVLKTLARQMKKEHELKSRIRGAMIYPAVILSAMIGIGILMMIMVVPRLAEVFEELGTELPRTTQAVMNTGNFLADNVILVLPGILIFLFLVKAILGTVYGKNFMDWFLLHFPLFGGITKKVNCARFSRNLGSLIESGVPIVRALQITADTLTNHYYKNSVLAASENVQKGEELALPLKQNRNLYPPLVVQMILVGEETGALSDIMKRLASFYEGEVNNITKNLSTIIEPVLMILIGAAVGFFAVSMIQPMYSMMEAI